MCLPELQRVAVSVPCGSISSACTTGRRLSPPPYLCQAGRGPTCTRQAAFVTLPARDARFYTPQRLCVVHCDQSVPCFEIRLAAIALYLHEWVSSQGFTQGCAVTLICHGPRFEPFRAERRQPLSRRAMHRAVAARVPKTCRVTVTIRGD